MKNFKLHPATSKPRKRKSLVETDIDKIGQAILTLTKEIWTLADRQIITENILKKKGIDITDEIEFYEPSPELEKELDKKRKALIKRVVDDLEGEYGPLEQN
ncbi:MAG: hypothetical protein VX397_02925 [Pseudomonadota bacterium]|nr:hypothetical protein [Pseudomonadota bacterium]